MEEDSIGVKNEALQRLNGLDSAVGAECDEVMASDVDTNSFPSNSHVHMQGFKLDDVSEKLLIVDSLKDELAGEFEQRPCAASF